MPGADGAHPVRWKLRSQHGLRIVRFEAEAAVFNPVSWHTHLLNDSAVQVLEALLAGPQPVDGIVAALAEEAPGAELARDEMPMIEALLADLEALGLVEKGL
jgi:PqqD family protein of HPr-rel-A system